MKSCITTLAIAVFALALPAQLSYAQGTNPVVAAEAFAPVVKSGTNTPAVEAAPPFETVDGNNEAGFAPVSRPAIPPQLGPAPTIGLPVAPIGYSTVGYPVGGSKSDGCTSKSGNPNCICPQCRRSRNYAGTWGSVEFMHLWMKGRNLPPLATTSPFPGTAPDDAGVLPAAEILFGNNRIGKGRQSAGRVDFGIWLDPQQNTGIGFKMFGIEGDKTLFNRSSSGVPILAVPFYNVDLAAQDAVEVAYPGRFEGSIDHRTVNNLMMGEAYARMTMMRGCGFRVDLLGGYHVARLDDGIGISSSTEVLHGAGPFAIGTTIDLYDSFKARNEMHGGEFGLLAELNQGPWSLKGLAKLTVANNRQSVSIAGNTIIDTGGGPVLIPDTGTFAQASNIGVYQRDKVTYIPEIGFTLGYDINDCWKMTVGYSAIYFPNVVMAGDHIDTRVSPSQASALPAFAWRETEQWAQAITFGAEWNF